MTVAARAPRLASEAAAAEYAGLPLSTFRAWVESGRLPKPLEDCGLYDTKAIDLAIDRLSGIGSPTSALDAWRLRRAS
jgi:hypothetical protein